MMIGYLVTLDDGEWFYVFLFMRSYLTDLNLVASLFDFSVFLVQNRAEAIGFDTRCAFWNCETRDPSISAFVISIVRQNHTVLTSEIKVLLRFLCSILLQFFNVSWAIIVNRRLRYFL